MTEAPPQFTEPLSAVACGGVLTALPALLKEGLLQHADCLSLPKGYYGLTSTLLLLAFLCMARVRTPEALRHQAPGEWGALLGAWCPEAKTLRCKTKQLAADEQRVRDWQDALATSCACTEAGVQPGGLAEADRQGDALLVRASHSSARSRLTAQVAGLAPFHPGE